MIISDFLRALGQLDDRRFRSVLVKGIGLSLGLLVLIYFVFLTLIGWFVPDQVSLPWIGVVTWADDILSIGSFFVMILLSIFLMVPVASAFTSIFLDEVVNAVEERHYPGARIPPSVPLLDAIRDSVSFLGIMIAANLLALILYIALPPFAPLIFWGLNGYLLGREYFQMVAMRRLGRDGARILYQRYRWSVWVAGFLMTVPLSIPLINLLVPVLGVATFTHLYHRVQLARP